MAESVSRTVEQVRGLVGWVGAGRRLTQTGRVTLADARHWWRFWTPATGWTR
ncbi:hypothetical protein [Streptomyces sp.]|uniref:hypothetical protein n=1 Tax=Streptomyces sp. TaxID=1931 RepID=UPI0025EB26C7|nr:hypothetical protein [Streptomyces sp.]